MTLIAFLGRQPELGIAELESLLPGKIVRVFGDNVELDIDYDRNFGNRLGGTMKLAKPLTHIDSTRWADIHKYLVSSAVEHAKLVPEGKLTIGLSAFGISASKKELERTSLSIKKVVKASGRPVRIVPNTETAMNSAQILHNHLTGENGWEIVLLRDGSKTLLCRTVWEQNIIAYTNRDQVRPHRDPRVGMLPPKLAQIIINLAAGTLQPEDSTLLDPFCGTGVLLQEASLMGFSIYGSDNDERMVEYTQKNLSWLEESFRFKIRGQKLELADATEHRWQPPINVVATEAFLGQPMSGKPEPKIIREEIARVQLILKKALRNIGGQLKPGTTCCFAIPAWFYENEVHLLPLIDQIEQIGYTIASFQHVRPGNLIYRREGQIVGRQLLVVTRK